MGRHFGDLAVIRGIIYYKLSPHEQKPFAGAITQGLPNMVQRAWMTLHTWLPVSILGYGLYIVVEEAYRRSKRKNLRDFLYEVDPVPAPAAKPVASSDGAPPPPAAGGKPPCVPKKKPPPS